MLRGLVIGVGSAALVVAGLTGCSSGDKAGDNKASDNKAEDKASAATATSGSVSASAGAGTAKVT
ncbi:MAG: hypothetical protein O3B27_08620, partial [Actinomycetota bacterium]|nr:hypothetical protein [Actinomycetota bacterium]